MYSRTERGDIHLRKSPSRRAVPMSLQYHKHYRLGKSLFFSGFFKKVLKTVVLQVKQIRIVSDSEHGSAEAGPGEQRSAEQQQLEVRARCCCSSGSHTSHWATLSRR